jgi:hypothetical protein
LAAHVDSHGTVDRVAADFVFNRLPPYEQKEEAKKDEGKIDLIDIKLDLGCRFTRKSLKLVRWFAVPCYQSLIAIISED